MPDSSKPKPVAPPDLPAQKIERPEYSFKKRLKIQLAGLGGSTYMYSLGSMMRLQTANPARVDPYRVNDGGAIYAMWHGPHFPTLYAYRHRGVCVITSLSADGEILTRVLESMGYKTIRGSSTRGGTSAMLNLARWVRNGWDAAIAVDGPKGPRYRVKEGILVLAKLTGAPIVPVVGSMDRCWRIKSWDVYRIPKPLCRAMVTGGRPTFVPPDATDELMEAKRLELEKRLRWMTYEIDQMVMKPKWPSVDEMTDHFINDEAVDVEI
jgi:lysophospholipid acyltransferase (LPLAT)-like uncharacterized protein